LHINDMAYDPGDDSLVVSSRENFLFKIDYESGAIRWLFGDDNKHWFVNYPSLRALSVTLLDNGAVPIGQHTPTIEGAGQILLFNNGWGSTQNPPGTPAGISLDSSRATRYRIDEGARTAEIMWNYDNGLSSLACSSVYQAGGEQGDYLLSYTTLDLASRSIIEIIDEAQTLLFQLEFPDLSCVSGLREAAIIRLESVNYRE
ncbi:MAG: aryl-sulfate sulfotransferase, partial [Halioglobus sp.]|nr:aryl-sulfate sulfotransferase [Halioglobus sp.]